MASTYEWMTVQANDIPIIWRLGASAASETILTYYLHFPGTYLAFRKSEILENSQERRTVQIAAQTDPLLPLASSCYLIRVASVGFLWFKFKHNYNWFLTSVF